MGAVNKQNMTKQDARDMGFEDIPHFTVAGSLIYNLGRSRHLSFGCIGTPNEMIFICLSDNEEKITDLVCLHNYDYDGYITKDKLTSMIEGIGKSD